MSIFAQAFDAADKAHNREIECDVPTKVQINTKCLGQGLYHFANRNGVKGEIVELSWCDVITDHERSAYHISIGQQCLGPFESYRAAKNHAALLEL